VAYSSLFNFDIIFHQNIYIHCAHCITMIIVKDAMVVIHLAKISLLENSCDFFKKVIIPEKVYTEIMVGKEKGYNDAMITYELINKNKIIVKKIKNKKLLKKANEFGIQRGEAEAVALYWQENAELLATDDDNVREKKTILNLKLIGTPIIILKLYREKIISKEKFISSVNQLRKMGWFSNVVIDKILMEVNK